jgi:hypothetical protein
MKKLLSFLLVATLMLGLPSLSIAKGKGKHGHTVHGKVTAVTETSITIEEGKKKGGKTETISVPAGTTIKGEGGGAAPQLSSLVGKHVTVKESSKGTASEIMLGKHKGKKKKSK